MLYCINIPIIYKIKGFDYAQQLLSPDFTLYFKTYISNCARDLFTYYTVKLYLALPNK